MLIRICLALSLLPLGARAETATAHYAAYAAGLNVLLVDARFDLSPADYRLQLEYRTTGAFSLFVRSQQTTAVQGGAGRGGGRPRSGSPAAACCGGSSG